MDNRRDFLKAASAASLTSLLSSPAFATAFPSKPINWIVPFKPGGGSDRWSRVLSSVALDVLDQPLRIKNMPGAAAVLGWEHMLQQPADGYTALIASPTPVIALTRHDNPPISPRQIKIVCFISAFNVILFTRPGKPWSTWSGLVNHAKSHPGKLLYGSTYSEMSGAALSFRGAEIDIKLKPYSSTSNAVTDLLGGQIDVAAATPSTIGQLYPDQVVTLLNATKMPLSEEVANQLGNPLHSIELGYQAINYPRWIGVHPDTPDDIVARLSDKIGRMLKQDSFKEIMGKMGEDIVFVSHAEAQAQFAEILAGINLAVDAIDA